MSNKEQFDEIVDFHGELNWYTLDCYTDEIQDKLKKLPISTYTVSIGNHKVHYYSWQLPTIKSFGYGDDYQSNGYPQPSQKFMKELRSYIRKSRYFNTSKTTIDKGKKLMNQYIR